MLPIVPRTSPRHTRSLYVCLLIFDILGSIYAHITLADPVPINSPKNSNSNYTNTDYSYSSPLNADGSNYPCKGYEHSSVQVVAEYAAGHTYTASFQGDATHGGGSCQFSLSYDHGQTFKVIKSIIGGCPWPLSYDFTIPSNAPSGTALFAWSWVNLIGNREFYMDCAWVQVDGTSSDTTDALSDLPDIYVANLAHVNDCKTQEGIEVVYPNEGRGPDFEYGAGLDDSSPITVDQACSLSNKSAGRDSPSENSNAVSVAQLGAMSSEDLYADDDNEDAEDTEDTEDTEDDAAVTIATSSAARATETQAAVEASSSSPSIAPQYRRLPHAAELRTAPVYFSPRDPPTNAVYVTVTASCTSKADATLTIVASTVTVVGMHSSQTCPSGERIAYIDEKAACIPASSRYWTWTTVTTSKAVTTSPTRASVALSSAGINSTGSTPSAAAPYAMTTAQYLPCVPGSFLCSDAKTFLTCDQAYQNGRYVWTWLYPRQVAAGMMCLPHLASGVGAGQQAGAAVGQHREDQYVRAI